MAKDPLVALALATGRRPAVLFSLKASFESCENEARVEGIESCKSLKPPQAARTDRVETSEGSEASFESFESLGRGLRCQE